VRCKACGGQCQGVARIRPDSTEDKLTSKSDFGCGCQALTGLAFGMGGNKTARKTPRSLTFGTRMPARVPVGARFDGEELERRAAGSDD
jgi:hypothetical protein